jgi:uncharacterized protein
MIIDAHTHVYANPKITPLRMETPFMSAEDQIALMDAKGIDKSVILPLCNAESPAEMQSIGEILSICEKYPGRFIPFCNLDPRLAKREDLITKEDYVYLLKQYKDLGCKGLGELTARLRWTEPPLTMLMAGCEEVGLPVTFHTASTEDPIYGVIDDVGLPGLEKMLQTFPKLIFLGHSPGFWNEISGGITIADKSDYPDGPVQPGGAVQRLMREYPNLYGDLSAGSGLNAFMRDPEHAYPFIDEFQDRLILGLDYCSPTNDMQHIEWLTAQKDAGHISNEVFEKIMWKNINNILELGL